MGMATLNQEQREYIIQRLSHMRDEKIKTYAPRGYVRVDDTFYIAAERDVVKQKLDIIREYEDQVEAAKLEKRIAINADFSQLEAEIILGADSVNFLDKLAEMEAKVY